MTRAQTQESDSPDWVEKVLHFWFSELSEVDWFAGDPGIDERVRDRFETLQKQLVANQGRGIHEPQAILAAVIVLDQFSRNLFRDTRHAFEADPIARKLARQAIDNGFDAAMSQEQRYFLYLPFEHSEDSADQVFAVSLIKQLNNESWSRYALAHQVLIDRFGRFPHRNAILGRESTAEEIIAMNEPMGSF